MSTLPNSSIGLNTGNIAESNINEAVWGYVSKHHLGKALAGSPLEQAPIPKGTVGSATALRKRILELSLAPDIYMNRSLKVKSPFRVG